MNLLDGRPIAAAIRAQARVRADALRACGVVPVLGVVVAAVAAGASSYLRGLSRAADLAGVRLAVRPVVPEPAAVLRAIDALAEDTAVHGILVPTPLPAGLDPAKVGDHIPPDKDVDGMSAIRAGRLVTGRPCQPPATAAAVLEILRSVQMPLRGAHAVVVGSGPVAGRPIALMLLGQDATVTVCHAATRDVAAVAREADVLVAAVGRPALVSKAFVKPGAVVVDVGINELDGRIVGDVDTLEVARIARAVTPVPGGVGPVTTAVLLRSTVLAAAPQDVPIASSA